MPDIDATELDTSARRDLSTGSIFARRFEILEKLGQGGMSSVYKARQVGMDRIVALKVMHAEIVLQDTAKQRFVRETQTIGALDHPNIVKVLAMELNGGDSFIAMEYLDGRTLADELRLRGTIAIEEAVSIVVTAAQALSHAHAKGVIHRDIKPSNIMLVGNGPETVVQIVDFGVARFIEPEPDSQKLTKTNAVVGTPYYMSPEQCDKRAVDHRSDIYSLGCVLFELITGSPPFKDDSALAIMLSHIHVALPDFPNGLPAWLTEITSKMLAKDPADRFQTMDELVASLSQKKAPPSVRAQRTRSQRKIFPTRRTVVIGLACVAILGISAAVMLTPHAKAPAVDTASRSSVARDNARLEVTAALTKARDQFRLGHTGAQELQATEKLLQKYQPLFISHENEIASVKCELYVCILGESNRAKNHGRALYAIQQWLATARGNPGGDKMYLVNALAERWQRAECLDPEKLALAMEAIPVFESATPLTIEGRRLLVERYAELIDILARKDVSLAMGPAEIAVQKADEAYQPRHREAAKARYRLATLCFTAGLNEKAEGLCKAVLACRDETGEVEIPDLAVSSAVLLKEIAYKRSDHATAAKYLRQAILVEQEQILAGKGNETQTLSKVVELAKLENYLHHFSDAKSLLDGAIARLINRPQDSALLMDAYSVQAANRFDQGDRKGATRWIEKAYALKIRLHQVNYAAAYMCNYRSLMAELAGDLPHAIQYERDALAVLNEMSSKKIAGCTPEHPFFKDCRTRLAALLKSAGQQ